MRFEVRDFDPLDVHIFAEAAAEVNVRPFIDKLEKGSLQKHGPAWMAFVDDAPVAASGFVELYGPGSIRAGAWAIFLPMPREATLKVYRKTRSILSAAPYRRIEAHVECDNYKARRWADLLGFKLEGGIKPNWFPTGHPAVEYVILK